MICTVAMGLRRKIGVCARILTPGVLFATIFVLGAPFWVHAWSDNHSEEMSDIGDRIAGAKARNSLGAGVPFSCAVSCVLIRSLLPAELDRGSTCR